jgi:hypothetical protein
MCGRRLAPAAAKKDIKDDTTVHRSAVVLVNAFSASTFNQVNTEKLPANPTGVTLKVWSPSCTATCPRNLLPQECTGDFFKVNFQFEAPQKKCTPKGK